MIKSVHFKNFKALIDATLPLNRFTLIVGPNGSGKSTAMQALQRASHPSDFSFSEVATASLRNERNAGVEVKVIWNAQGTFFSSTSSWRYVDGVLRRSGPEFDLNGLPDLLLSDIYGAWRNFQIYTFDARALATSVQLHPNMTLSPNGSDLAGVLDNLRDKEPERFESLNEELGRWLPEFDRILFETLAAGCRSILLRTRSGHRIEASDLSHGTLFALGFITLAYLPNPPAIVCFEEPERGIHPRLLREVRDAMYRLCYPEEYGEKRNPVQVIATTHSPYFLDLYKDHPEEIVIAHKDERGVHFERLSDKPNVDEFLQDAPLGEVWYSGVLGGVPSNP
jgi:predicted ATPase